MSLIPTTARRRHRAGRGRGGDRWVEVVRWRTLAEAEKAAVAAESSERCVPMFGLIDMDSVLMLHGEPVVAYAAAGAR